jgi:hypothetical protein
MTPAWKPQTGTDTDGILDRCTCGARGRMLWVSLRYVAHCSDKCGMITGHHGRAIDAATEWNKLVRKLSVDTTTTIN